MRWGHCCYYYVFCCQAEGETLSPPCCYLESSLRIRIRQTNALLRYQCRKLPYLSFLEQSSEWTTDSGLLNKNAFFRDHLHLIKGGNDILARQLASVIGPLIAKGPRTRPHRVCVNRPPLLPDVCSYRPPDLPSPMPIVNIPPVSHHRRQHRFSRTSAHPQTSHISSPSSPTPTSSCPAPASPTP